MKRTIWEPEIELIVAVYRQARADLLVGAPGWQLDAETFFIMDGFDPAEIRQAWAGREPKSKLSEAARARRQFIRERRGQGALFTEIADALGLTPSRVRQIYNGK